MDHATRAYNHSFPFDAHVRSLLDTDFYKLLMMQFIWARYRDLDASFQVINRSKHVRLADTIPEREIRAQLDHVRSLTFREGELTWLAGNQFYGRRNIFSGEFIDALRDFRMTDYELRKVDGQYDITFSGPWWRSMLWEIPALSAINATRTSIATRGMSKYELKILYARAMAKQYDNLCMLRDAGITGIADFSTRRRHNFLWQQHSVEALVAELGTGCIGTSNAYLAKELDLEAIGTNAHELPMVMTALAGLEQPENIDWLRDAPYRLCQEWADFYGGNLRVGLVDTYGTSGFLQHAAEKLPSIREWTGFRIDSKDAILAGEELITFWRALGIDAKEKLQLFSDGLTAPEMVKLHRHFAGRTRLGFGWGTNLSNDFRGCDPRGGNLFDPISLVCKVKAIRHPELGKAPAVKLSDNYLKATGQADAVAHYRNVFGTLGMSNIPVTV